MRKLNKKIKITIKKRNKKYLKKSKNWIELFYNQNTNLNSLVETTELNKPKQTLKN